MLAESEFARFSETFCGREKELRWLFDRFKGRSSPVLITGARGIGKTVLLQQFLAGLRDRRSRVLWSLRGRSGEAMSEISTRIEELHVQNGLPEILAIDDADALTEREIIAIADRTSNLKAIGTVMFAMEKPLRIPHGEILELGPLGDNDALELLRRLGPDIPPDLVAEAVARARGVPRALALIAYLASERDAEDLSRALKGDVYDLGHGLTLPEKELIAEVEPRIILANEGLMDRLISRPQSVFQLPSRKFEELIAEILSDLGYDVELTPAIRDGGKDILAYMSTPHGRLLCLVEAKKYRRDRTVGVELVRQLYGTLVDADASSAMLVTTSSFSPDARSFQKRHEYKLALRDYGDVVNWIQGYGKR